MQRYLFGEHVYGPEHEHWQRILQKGYTEKLRPVCQCLARGEGLSIYIALVRGQYVLKRMPYSGPRHAPHCDHYEPPPELSGVGQVKGVAIREQMETGSTNLALDFPLSKGRSRKVSGGVDVEHDSVRSDGTKLTLRGLLHFLFDEAGLTRWSPRMAGKRSWYVVRRELLHAASGKFTKGQSLQDVLFIPETFDSEHAQEIKQRRLDSLVPLASSSNARMIVIGEIKAIEDARFGKCLIVRHLPDMKLMMTDDLHKHLVARFNHQLQLWGQLEATRLVFIGTISRSEQKIYIVEAACLMNVNENWIPYETIYEWELLQKLHGECRRFTKGLRYNLPSSTPLACAVLQDTGEISTALYVVPTDLEGAYAGVVEELSQRNRITAWQWRTGSEPMAELPSRSAAPQGSPAEA